MKKLIGLLLVLLGILGIIMAMNDNVGRYNLIGALLFGLACLLGAKHAKDELHPIWWVQDKYELFKQYFILWRL